MYVKIDIQILFKVFSIKHPVLHTCKNYENSRQRGDI